MRYDGQGGELAVAWPGRADAACAAFAQAHQSLYGFTLEAPIELVTLRVEATGRLPAPVMPRLATGSGAMPIGHRDVHLADGTRSAAVYDRASLAEGDHFRGPAIVTQLDATTLVPPGWAVDVHGSGALLVRRV
jgi:N-methylhydantoinase A